MKGRLVTTALAAFALVAACGIAPQHAAKQAAGATVPFSLLNADAPPLVPTTSPKATQPVSLCFVRDRQLSTIVRDLDVAVSLGGVVAALALPPATEGLRTALTDTTIVREVRVAGGVAQVDLRQAISGLGGDDQLLAVAQIVCTLTARPGVGQVVFTLEGAPIGVPRGDGSLVTTPVARDDYAALLTGP